VGAHPQSTDTLVHVASHAGPGHSGAGPWSPWLHTYTHTHTYVCIYTYTDRQYVRPAGPPAPGSPGTRLLRAFALSLWQALSSIRTDAEQPDPTTRKWLEMEFSKAGQAVVIGCAAHSQASALTSLLMCYGPLPPPFPSISPDLHLPYPPQSLPFPSFGLFSRHAVCLVQTHDARGSPVPLGADPQAMGVPFPVPVLHSFVLTGIGL